MNPRKNYVEQGSRPPIEKTINATNFLNRKKITVRYQSNKKARRKQASDKQSREEGRHRTGSVTGAKRPEKQLPRVPKENGANSKSFVSSRLFRERVLE
jgi:hypothetical protein